MLEIGSKYASSLYRIASTVTNGNLEGWTLQEISKDPHARYTCGDRIWDSVHVFEENLDGFNITYAFHKQCRNSVVQ